MNTADKAVINAARRRYSREAIAMSRATEAAKVDETFCARVLAAVHAIEADGHYPSIDRLMDALDLRSKQRIVVALRWLKRSGRWRGSSRRKHLTAHDGGLLGRDDREVKAIEDAIKALRPQKAKRAEQLAEIMRARHPYVIPTVRRLRFRGTKERYG